MKKKITLEGSKKKDTYESLVEYLDGGQETINYPDRLATPLRNSHEISNIIDGEGLGWLEGANFQICQLRTYSN